MTDFVVRSTAVTILVFCSIRAAGQDDTIYISLEKAEVAIQRYHQKPLRDTLVLCNDFNFGVMISRIHINYKDHNGEMAEPNYMRPGECGHLIITAPPASLVHPYQMEYRLTVYSDLAPNFNHTLVIKVKADYNS